MNILTSHVEGVTDGGVVLFYFKLGQEEGGGELYSRRPPANHQVLSTVGIYMYNKIINTKLVINA